MIKASPIELELRKLGLKEKEVKVYLTGLELGPSSVQEIAAKANISRPTAYEIIKSLEKKGLFAETKKGKKRYFLAQSPVRILGILKTQKKELEEKEREFIRIIATLEAKYSLKGKGEIKIYKGKEGLKALGESFSFTSSPEIFIFCSQINAKEVKKREATYHGIKKRLGRLQVKEILPKKAKLAPASSQTQRKYMLSPVSSSQLRGTLILCDKAIFLPSQKAEGFLIESELIVDLLKSLFLTLWNSI